jgi:peptidoglycan/xylan/chitin deacetylase (PgdA/CDA1 family)
MYQSALSHWGRREVQIVSSQPIISFTFDDIPRSAFRVGGEILASHGARGTYYIAPSLSGITNELGEHFHETDLCEIVSSGHEVGCHTFGHISCRKTPLTNFKDDVVKSHSYVKSIDAKTIPLNFSYPFGHVTFGAKRALGRLHQSCRGTFPGINTGMIDLNLLRANRLYNRTTSMDAVRRLIDENKKCCGWLIFYTHDVRNAPSAFGCTPTLFTETVRCALDSGAYVVPVRDALRTIRGETWTAGEVQLRT